MADPVSNLPDAVLAALRAGDPLQAAKLLRQAKGVSLRHAKAVIETWMADGRPLAAEPPSGAAAAPSAGSATFAGRAPVSVAEALAAGNQAEAVRMMRELTGLGLHEAKEAVESMLPASKRKLRIVPSDGLSPGEVPRSAGVGRWLTLAVLGLLGLYYLLRSPG